MQNPFRFEKIFYDIMIYPIIEEMSMNTELGVLYLSGKGFDPSCEVFIGDMSCKKLAEEKFTSENHIMCKPVSSRAHGDLTRYPAGLGMRFESYDVSKVDAKLDWSLVSLFANNFELIENRFIFQSDVHWLGEKTMAKITGYFRPVSARGSFRVLTNGIVLFRIRRCEPKTGICAKGKRLVIENEVFNGYIYTDTIAFHFDSIYYLEVYVLTESKSGENFLKVDILGRDEENSVMRLKARLGVTLNLSF